jgi:ribonuclease BN (tRNA processing enzyme)
MRRWLLVPLLVRSLSGQGPTPYDSACTQIVLLGTGTPNAEPDRSGPAVAVTLHGRAYLIDAGPGVVRRAAAAVRDRGVSALRMENLRVVFITHLHSDHTVGLPDVMLTPWVLDRTAPLEVYGPPGIRAMVDHLLAAYAADIDNRRTHDQPHNDSGWRAQAHEIRAGPVYRDEFVSVTAFAVPHDGWSESYAYRFETGDRTIVVSGDSRPSDVILQACDGCDVLVHEVYSQAGFERLPPAWQRYHAGAHTSAVALGRLAARARPGLLVLYHGLAWSSSPEEILQEIREGYAGPVTYGNDLDAY